MRAIWIKVVIVVVATIALVYLVVAHVAWINGSRFHRWGWWEPPIALARIVPAMLLAAVPFFVGIRIQRRSSMLALACVSLSTFFLQLAALGVQKDPFNLGRAAEIVMHPWTTSYFTDARALIDVPLRDWLSAYHRLLPEFNIHSREKPPGPILYWWIFQKLFTEPGTAALAGSALIAIFASLAAPAIYWLANLLTRNAQAAFAAAAYIALIPGVVLVFPSFDQCYPVIACAIVCCWIQSLRTGQARWAIACGIALTLGIFFTYTLLVLGAFMLLFGLLEAHRKSLVRQSLIVVAVVLIVYLLMWLVTGFNPITTFASAWRNQMAWKASFEIPRAHPQTVPGDLQDFLLGSGWISVLFIVYWVIDARKHWTRNSTIVALCLLQPLIVAATGLLQCETARVWTFMQPLVLVPVGIELSRWKFAARMVAYACLFAILIAQAQNFIFQF